MTRAVLRNAKRWTGRELDLIVRPARGRAQRCTLELRRSADGALLARGSVLGAHAELKVAARDAGAVRRALPALRSALGAMHVSLRGGRLGTATATAVRTAGVLSAIPADYGSTRALPRQREPRELVAAGIDAFGREQWLEARAARAWLAMRRAARADGVELQLVSAYRSIAYQARLLARKLRDGQALERILEVNAAPGYSEHHSGRAIDVTTPGCRAVEPEFEHSPAFAWLLENAARFGYRLSFPRDNPHGIAYEPWHWYYRGLRAEG